MLNDKPGLYWKICWKFVAPIFIIVVFFASLIGMMINGIGYQRWDILEVSAGLGCQPPFQTLLVTNLKEYCHAIVLQT